MSEHRITIEPDHREESYAGRCSCGEQEHPSNATYDEAYDAITAHLHEQGIPDSEIILPLPQDQG